MKKNIFIPFLVIIYIMLAGCSSQQDSMPAAKANWTIYPFYNNTDKTEAVDQIQRMLTVQAPTQGLINIKLPPEAEVSSARYSLAQAHRIQSSRQWAQQHNIQYALAGTIDQWEINEDGKPVVNLTMEVINIADNNKLLTTSSRSEGRPGDDLFEASRQLLKQMLSGLPITQ